MTEWRGWLPRRLGTRDSTASPVETGRGKCVLEADERCPRHGLCPGASVLTHADSAAKKTGPNPPLGHVTKPPMTGQTAGILPGPYLWKMTEKWVFLREIGVPHSWEGRFLSTLYVACVTFQGRKLN